MEVEIAVIDNEGERKVTHGFEEVLSFEHERESDENGWTARIYLTMENGTETVVGEGYGLEVVRAEETTPAEVRGAVPHGQEIEQ